METYNKNKQAIVSVAADIFKKYGFEKTSISDITKVLGKGRTSVYNHFKNKEEIFKAVVESQTGIYFQELNNMLLTKDTAAAKLAVFCNIKFCFITSVQKEYMLLHENIIHNSFLKTTLSQNTASKEIKILKSIIDTGIKKGEFKRMESQQIKLTASLFQTTINAVLKDLHEKNSMKSCITAGKIVESMFINSLINYSNSAASLDYSFTKTHANNKVLQQN